VIGKAKPLTTDYHGLARIGKRPDVKSKTLHRGDAEKSKRDFAAD
jgi:hypothetical protein